MKKRENPVLKQDYTVTKVIWRLFRHFMYWFIIAAFVSGIIMSLLENFGVLEKTKDTIPLLVLPFFIIFILFLTFFYLQMANKNNWDSTGGSLSPIKYKELVKLMEDEVFYPTGTENLKESEYWVYKKGNAFIPKSFIIGVSSSPTVGIYYTPILYIMVHTLTGFSYKLRIHEKKALEFARYLQSINRGVFLIDGINWEGVSDNYTEYLENGGTVEELLDCNNPFIISQVEHIKKCNNIKE